MDRIFVGATQPSIHVCSAVRESQANDKLAARQGSKFELAIGSRQCLSQHRGRHSPEARCVSGVNGNERTRPAVGIKEPSGNSTVRLHVDRDERTPARVAKVDAPPLPRIPAVWEQSGDREVTGGHTKLKSTCGSGL